MASAEGGLFRYVYSCDLKCEKVEKVEVMSLEGRVRKPSVEELAADASLYHCASLPGPDPSLKKALFVTAHVVSDGAVVGLGAQTAHKTPGRQWNWSEWLRLPVAYAELSRDAALLLNIWDYHENPLQPHCVGGTAISLFSKRGVFRKGMYDLKVLPFLEVTVENYAKDMGKKSADGSMRRLAKLSKKHRAGLIEKVDWLDRLAFREIEVVNEAEKRDSSDLFLILQFPTPHFAHEEHAIVYFEKNGADMVWHQPNPPVVKFLDPEVGLDNLVEAKHHQLTRSSRSDAVDGELKPNMHARDQLDFILALPSSQPLSGEQRDLVWKFRYYLSSNKNGLGKFLHSVQWEDEKEVVQAVGLLEEWSPIDAEDSLELLSPEFPSPAVRRYAVSRLRVAPVDEILLYLPQLVQALRYEYYEKTPPLPENPDSASPSSSPPPAPENEEDLAGFLISTAVRDFVVANHLFWYLNVESQPRASGTSGQPMVPMMMEESGQGWGRRRRRGRGACSRGSRSAWPGP